MTQLMHYDWTAHGIVGCGHQIAVKNSPTTIIVRICQYQYMFAWYTGKDIVQAFQVQSGKIARTIKGIKIAVQYRVSPQ